MWEYFYNPSTNPSGSNSLSANSPSGWLPVKENDYLESTYQRFLSGKNTSGTVFHSFGNGASVGVNFKDMKTFSLSKNSNEFGTSGGDGVFLVRRSDK